MLTGAVSVFYYALLTERAFLMHYVSCILIGTGIKLKLNASLWTGFTGWPLGSMISKTVALHHAAYSCSCKSAYPSFLGSLHMGVGDQALGT
jgi:hypothetical protein